MSSPLRIAISEELAGVTGSGDGRDGDGAREHATKAKRRPEGRRRRIGSTASGSDGLFAGPARASRAPSLRRDLNHAVLRPPVDARGIDHELSPEVLCPAGCHHRPTSAITRNEFVGPPTRGIVMLILAYDWADQWVAKHASREFRSF